MFCMYPSVNDFWQADSVLSSGSLVLQVGSSGSSASGLCVQAGASAAGVGGSLETSGGHGTASGGGVSISAGAANIMGDGSTTGGSVLLKAGVASPGSTCQANDGTVWLQNAGATASLAILHSIYHAKLTHIRKKVCVVATIISTISALQLSRESCAIHLSWRPI